MSWKKTKFLDWPCWESGRFRIMADRDAYDLYVNCGISTSVYSGFETLEAAQRKAEWLTN